MTRDTQEATRPIGVFDSGMGGLTVLRALHELLPGEDIIYFGDTARVPYGTKGEKTVRAFASQDAGLLVELGQVPVVHAENAASPARGTAGAGDPAHRLDGFCAMAADKGPIDVAVLRVVGKCFVTVKIDKGDTDREFFLGPAEIAARQHGNTGVIEQPVEKQWSVATSGRCRSDQTSKTVTRHRESDDGGNDEDRRGDEQPPAVEEEHCLFRLGCCQQLRQAMVETSSELCGADAEQVSEADLEEESEPRNNMILLAGENHRADVSIYRAVALLQFLKYSHISCWLLSVYSQPCSRYH